MLTFRLLLQESLEFSNTLQILGTTGGPLQFDKFLQMHTPEPDTKGLNRHRIRQQVAVATPARHLAQQIQVALAA